MSQDNKLVDLGAERAKRVHDLNEKRLNEVRQAFEQAMPLKSPKKKRRKSLKSAEHRRFPDLYQLFPLTPCWPESLLIPVKFLACVWG